jgi:UV DNA damage endonuclease
MIRLGYACLSLGMPEPSMKTAQLGRFLKGLVDLTPIYRYNAEYVRRSIMHSAGLGLLSYRISSDLFPLLDIAPGARMLVPDLRSVRRAAERCCVHLSNHPSQFVVLSSPREEVVLNSLAVMNDQGWVMDLLGARGSITLHGGGVYGDRDSTAVRLREGIARLTPAARSRLALENDERGWTVPELLDATRGEVPIVFDHLHWAANPRSAPYAVELEGALGTWPADRVPELHYSEQWEGKPAGAHAEHITGRGLLRFCEAIEEASGGREVAVIVEAKRKDLAVVRAIGELTGRQRARLEALAPGSTRGVVESSKGHRPSRVIAS